MFKWFNERSWRQSADEWKRAANEWEQSYYQLQAANLRTENKAKVIEETNLRLISQLRQMDQGVFDMSQQPNWEMMRPKFAKLLEMTMTRMEKENDRICGLMVNEITSAYNEPTQLRKFNQGVEVIHPKQIEGKK